MFCFFDSVENPASLWAAPSQLHSIAGCHMLPPHKDFPFRIVCRSCRFAHKRGAAPIWTEKTLHKNTSASLKLLQAQLPLAPAFRDFPDVLPDLLLQGERNILAEQVLESGEICCLDAGRVAYAVGG